MSDDVLDRLTAALADRYGIERELGRGAGGPEFSKPASRRPQGRETAWCHST
ncbi:MAG: hypothetical protein GTO46_13785 [Gemmatimonadetes bacterium]|nr:hypothetical protein [Gemmatimonadota bacterium]NIO32655.1 hypothetical protein [Gemmatimonadota bacterium]